MSQSDTIGEYRAELFGTGDCEEAPFWVAVQLPHGGQRSEAGALAMVKEFWGDEEDDQIEWAVKCVPMYVYSDEWGGLRVNRDHRDGAVGPIDFWEVDWL
jgi:hypothetical protein